MEYQLLTHSVYRPETDSFLLRLDFSSAHNKEQASVTVEKNYGHAALADALRLLADKIEKIPNWPARG